jgi:hypothetical protein
MERDTEKSDEAALEPHSSHTAPDVEKQDESNKLANEMPAPQAVNPMHPSQFPDGGAQAWLVVFGGFTGLVVSFGWINCESSFTL